MFDSLKFFSAAIEELPLTNSPMVFGLHANAEIGYYTQATKEMWNILIELQPKTCKIYNKQTIAIF